MLLLDIYSHANTYFISFFLLLFASSILLSLINANNNLKIPGAFMGTLVFLILLIYLFIFFYGFVNQVHREPFLYATYNTNIISNYNNILIFSNTIIILSVITSLISIIYLSERYIQKHMFNLAYFLLFIVCTIQMTTSDNILSMFVYFEFLFLPSLYFVYTLSYSKKANATVGFLLRWTLTGSFIVLFGVGYIYSMYSTLSYSELYLLKYSNIESCILFFVFFVGFGIKLPIWPFYYWLTKVHVEAPTGFSMFLSGFLVKTAFFCLVPLFSLYYSKLCFIVSFSLVIWGSIDSSIRMWTSFDIKRLIAFATVQEMNLILLFLFMLEFRYTSVLNCFLLVHGILSTFFFFLIDQVQKQIFSRNLFILGGLSLLAPMLLIFVWIALLIYRGFPLFIKFHIEWELLLGLVSNLSYLGFLFFFLISFFGVLGFCRVWFIVLYGMPFKSFSRDFLKKDYIVAIFLSSTLCGLSFFSNYF